MVFSWLFRGPLLSRKTVFGPFSLPFPGFFVAFSWFFRGPRFGQISRVLALEQASESQKAMRQAQVWKHWPRVAANSREGGKEKSPCRGGRWSQGTSSSQNGTVEEVYRMGVQEGPRGSISDGNEGGAVGQRLTTHTHTTPQRYSVRCKIPWPFFSPKPPALTSINRRKSAINPEIASVNVY